MVSQAPPLERPRVQVTSFVLEPLVQTLKSTLPASTFKAITSILRQVHKTAMNPLLRAPKAEELPAVFSQVYPKFVAGYMAASFLLWDALGEKALGWLPTTYDRLKSLLTESGPQKIGEEVTDAALLGLNTMAVVSQGIARQARRGEMPLGEELLELTGVVIAWALAMNTVLTYLTSRYRRPRYRRNAAILAHWSDYYALLAYRLSKRLGLLEVPQVSGELEGEQVEDSAFAEAALEDLAGLEENGARPKEG